MFSIKPYCHLPVSIYSRKLQLFPPEGKYFCCMPTLWGVNYSRFFFTDQDKTWKYFAARVSYCHWRCKEKLTLCYLKCLGFLTVIKVPGLSSWITPNMSVEKSGERTWKQFLKLTVRSTKPTDVKLWGALQKCTKCSLALIFWHCFVHWWE